MNFCEFELMFVNLFFINKCNLLEMQFDNFVRKNDVVEKNKKRLSDLRQVSVEKLFVP